MERQFNNKKLIATLVLAIIVVTTICLVLIYRTQIRKSSISNYQTYQEEDKIYSVKEAIKILETNPDQFKNKDIRIQAYHVNSTLGVGCKDYIVLMDMADVIKDQAISNRLMAESQTLSEIETKKLHDEIDQIPHIYTGPQSNMHNIFPTQYAIYVGHFYDKLITKSCGNDAWKRFVITSKEKEIVSN